MIVRAAFIFFTFLTMSVCLSSEREFYAEFEWHAPIRYVINGSFDVAQNDNWFGQHDFFQKNKTVWRRVRNPIKSIERDGGFGRFFKDEFLSDRAIPNYLLHTIGGAYDGAWLTEYYNKRSFSHSYLYAIVTSYLARWGNEVLEAGNENITSHDHIADLFFFDSLGLFLSTNETAMTFLVNEMGMRAWHSIPYYDPKEEDFYNSGLNYIIRPKVLKLGERLGPFFYFGMQNIWGLSFYSKSGVFSIGSGLFLTDPLKRKMRLVTSLFYEKNQRLAFSAFLNGSEGYRWRFNVYPKLLQLSKSIKVSMLLGEKRSHYDSDYGLGINLNMPFGLGAFL